MSAFLASVDPQRDPREFECCSRCEYEFHLFCSSIGANISLWSLRYSTITRLRGPSRAHVPFNTHFGWLSSASDQRNQNAVRASARKLQASPIYVGQGASQMPLSTSTIHIRYAAGRLVGSQPTKPAVDTEDVMGLTGRFDCDPEHGKWSMLFMVNGVGC